MKNYFLEPILTQGSASSQYADFLLGKTALVQARAPRPQLCIMPVPQSLALAPRNRYYLAVVQEGHRWCYPLQFTRQELTSLLPEIEQLNWAVGPDGVPESLAALHTVMERMMGGEQ